MSRSKNSASKAAPASQLVPQTSEAEAPLAGGAQLSGQLKPSESTDVGMCRQPGGKGAKLPEVPVDPLERRNWMIWCTGMLVDRIEPLVEAAEKAWDLDSQVWQLSQKAKSAFTVAEAKRLEANAKQLNALVNSTFQRLRRATAPWRPYWERVCQYVDDEHVEVDPGLGLMHPGFWHELPTFEVIDWLQAVKYSLLRHQSTVRGASAWPLAHSRSDTSSASNTTSPAGSTIVLRDMHLTLLVVLADKGRLMRARELADQREMPGYDTVRKLLNELETMKLVQRPKGARSGYCITSAGIKLLRDRELLPGSD